MLTQDSPHRLDDGLLSCQFDELPKSQIVQRAKSSEVETGVLLFVLLIDPDPLQ